MKDAILTRMGDGEQISMSTDEVREDIQAATQDAARRAEIPELTQEEIEQLVEIMAEPSRAVSVNHGQEVVVTDDGCSMSFYSGQDGGGVGVSMSRLQAILTYERALAADTTSMGHSDYSFKPVKPIINFEMNEYYTASMMTTAPFLYGAQPNMGLYFQPDGPHENPADLLPRGKIKEARDGARGRRPTTSPRPGLCRNKIKCHRLRRAQFRYRWFRRGCGLLGGAAGRLRFKKGGPEHARHHGGIGRICFRHAW